ncbi:MAG: HAD family hydrolase [Pirellulales bacterium]
MRQLLAVQLLLWIPLVVSAQAPPSSDPLPSWNDRSAKQSIIGFVQRVTEANGKDFIPVPQRIAVFDNDGTLWPENPVPFQLAFAVHSLRQELAVKPELKDDPDVKAILAGDVAALTEDHYRGLLRVIALTHAGMTTDEFAARVNDWISTVKHPRYDRTYDQCVYQPMLELLSYLRANGFKTFIVSGGGVDFMRVWSERVYGIAPEQVVGSYGRAKFEMRDDKPVLIKTVDQLFVDDKDGKPEGIHMMIGRRPVLCVGNSDGDQAMLEYTTIANPLPSLGVLVHHTDADREYAYDAHPKSSGKLVTALTDAARRGWSVVDMKTDWNQILPPSDSPR